MAVRMKIALHTQKMMISFLPPLIQLIQRNYKANTIRVLIMKFELKKKANIERMEMIILEAMRQARRRSTLAYGGSSFELF